MATAAYGAELATEVDMLRRYLQGLPVLGDYLTLARTTQRSS